MAVTKFVGGISRGTAVSALPDGTFVVASTGGTLTRYDAAGAVLDTASTGAAIGGLVAHPDGDGVLATVNRRGIYEVRFGPAPSTTLLRKLSGARGISFDAATGTALATSTTGGRLLRMPLDATTKSSVLTSGVLVPAAVAARAGAAAGWVLSAATPAQVLHVDFATGAATPLPIGLGRARDLSWTDAAGTELAIADLDGTIVVVDVADPAAAPVTLATGLDRVWSIDLVPGGGALVAGVGTTLCLVDLPVAPAVRLEMPLHPLYLSSWERIGVSGADIDDLVFRVDPPIGGLVSASRDATFAARPSVLLAASAVPGTYKLVAHDRITGDELAAGAFDVTDVWTGTDGPPVSFVGEVGTDSPDPAWGGGDPFVPQNLSVTPVLGNRNVAVVLTETNDSTALSAAAQATLRTEWTNEVFDGVMRGGVLESSRRYWRDVSGNQMDLVNAGVVGPIRLANNWTDYGTNINATTGQTDGWEAFGRAVVADLRTQNEARAAAGQPPVVDLMTVDSIVLVVRSLPASGAMNPGRFVWPSATRPGGYQLTFEVARQTFSVSFPWGSIDVTVPIVRTIQMFTMPDDWETRESSGRVRGETVAHELGHNFGLPDEYARSKHAQWAKDRDLASTTAAGASWSMMSWEEQFPQPTVVEKMMLGWVQAGHVRNLSFATLGPVDEEVVLHASDLGAPPAGRHSVAEVRIADGRNYYFEYRREQPTTLKDQDVPADRTVIGTDCVSGDEPEDRRNILRIRDDSDVDRGEFQQGDDYEEKDTSSAAYPNDFKMDVVETGTDFARIHITYGDAKPDPQIQPWAPSTNWKSPDLRVTNARNLADSRFADIPWEGHDNRIVATVRNPGKIDATGVRVDFFVKDFTLGGGAETALGSDTHDVGSGDVIEFTSSVPWVPPPLSAIPFLSIAPHYCVVARIAEYTDPANPAIREITLDNNEAQSNHTQLISVSASPSTREMGVVKVTNPLPTAADCRVVVRQTSQFSRTYVEHAWVHLQPGAERNVMFMTESVIGDPALEPLVREYGERIYKETNSVRLTGIADDHETCHGFVTGGAHVLVRAARATRFVKFGEDGGLAFGRIEAVDDGSGVDGTVLVTLTSPDDPTKEVVHGGTVQDGDFRIELGRVRAKFLVQGHFTGGFDTAPCESDQLIAH
jgi:M6 family metalloprotease-like protein